MAEEKSAPKKAPKKEAKPAEAVAEETKKVAPAADKAPAAAPAGAEATAEAPKAPTAADLLKDEVTALKVRKAKGAKNITTGIAFVTASFNNTIVSITDLKGNVISRRRSPSTTHFFSAMYDMILLSCSSVRSEARMFGSMPRCATISSARAGPTP